MNQSNDCSPPENMSQNDSNSIPENSDELKANNMETDDSAIATMCGIMSMAQVRSIYYSILLSDLIKISTLFDKSSISISGKNGRRRNDDR